MTKQHTSDYQKSNHKPALIILSANVNFKINTDTSNSNTYTAETETQELLREILATVLTAKLKINQEIRDELK